MKIENFKLVNKPPIICSFDVFFEDKGFGVREFKLMETNGSKWIAHPSRQYKDNENKTKYFQFTYFLEKRKVKFDEQVFAMLKPFLDSATSEPVQQSFADESIPF